MKLKYSWLPFALLGLTACDVNNDLDPIVAPQAETVAVNANGLDFSNYVSIGASFTAGVTDSALFIAAQENSFPNILSKKFALAGGGAFTQPLMSDNIGGLLFAGNVIQGPRLFFNGSGPVSLATLGAKPTTEVTTAVTGNINNYGIPGAKSFHFVAPGYGNPAGLAATPRTANPYFVRVASSPTTTLLADVVAKRPTFFTLSEFGGNDVLGYALSGAESNTTAANYNPITPTATFNAAFTATLNALTGTGAKGVVANVPYITSLAHFKTVPYNPLDPRGNSDAATRLKAQIPLLNNVYGAINRIYAGAGQPERSIVFAADKPNALVIYDEDATDLSTAITNTLAASSSFAPFVQSLGLPAAAAPLVAQLLGQQYGKARSATDKDLFVLPSRTVIGTVNADATRALITRSGGALPATLAGQFSAEGITLPLADKWVLTPKEQEELKMATDAYNTTIETAVNANDNLVLVDLKGLLQQASSSAGVQFDDFVFNGNLVTGGLVSLDGVHLTAKGYALMANRVLAAMDTKFGSNFTKATNGLAKANDFPSNYSPLLR